MRDILHLLEIVEEMSNSNCEIIEDDVVDIFCKSNTKKICESGLIELEVYKNGQNPKFGKPKLYACRINNLWLYRIKSFTLLFFTKCPNFIGKYVYS